jgi:hypothetical protein
MFLMDSEDYSQNQLAYWRKANSVHGWFVKNVQNGVDDCGYYEVSKEQLETLLDLAQKCARLIHDGKPEEAFKLLPPTQGFFFGAHSTESYLADMGSTIAQVAQILDCLPPKVFYYASW